METVVGGRLGAGLGGTWRYTVGGGARLCSVRKEGEGLGEENEVSAKSGVRGNEAVFSPCWLNRCG